MARDPSAVKRLWQDRWVRALAVAVAVAFWPACAQLVDEHPVGDDGETLQANLDFVLQDMQGNDVNLADYKGRPVLVNMWATWCGPCKHEIPWFVEFMEKYGGQGFTVLGVSVDDPPEDLVPFAAEYQMNYPVLVGLGNDAIARAYEADILVPTSWFIHRDGSVHARSIGVQGKDWFEEQVQAILE